MKTFRKIRRGGKYFFHRTINMRLVVIFRQQAHQIRVQVKHFGPMEELLPVYKNKQSDSAPLYGVSIRKYLLVPKN